MIHNLGRTKNALNSQYSKYAFQKGVTVHSTKTVPKSSALAVATQANRKVNQIKSQIEYSYTDTINKVGLGTAEAISYGGTVPQYLNNTERSLNDSAGRKGDKITCSYMEARFSQFYLSSMVASQLNNYVRIIVLWDYDDTIAAGSDIIEVAALGTSEAITSPLVWDKKKKYRILYDKLVTTNYDSHNKVWKIKKKLPNIKTQYSNGGTSPIKGAIKLFMVSDASDPSATNGPYMNYWFRIHYTDF